MRMFLCVFVVLIGLAVDSLTNPDGSCTNPMIWKFDTMQEYNDFIATDNSNNQNTVAVRYNISTKNNALCLDGTNGVFYYRPGFGDGLTKYLLFMEGGGSCGDIQSCQSRAYTYKGSTINDTKFAWFQSEFLMANKDYNPLIYNWNVIFLRYCDGSSFSGNNASETIVNTSNGTQQLYFRGYHILTNALEYISSELKLSFATDIILSGCSAGGVATYYHADYVLNNFVPSAAGANYMAMPESGFFLQSSNNNNMISMFNLHNMSAAMNQECIKMYENENLEYQCAYAQYIMPVLKSKCFALQSKFDAVALMHEPFKNNWTAVNEWGNDVVQEIMNDYINNGKYHMNHGAFFDSCSHHCGEYNHIIIDGYMSSEAMYEWYENGEKNHNRLYMQNTTYPCSKCCFPPNNITNGPDCVDSHN